MACQGHPRSLIFAPVDSACVCDFLLVINSNLGPILPSFRDIAGFLRRATPPLFHPNFRGVPLALDCRCCESEERPRPGGGAYSAPPDLLTVFKGPTSKGREGRGVERKEKGKWGKRGGKGEDGKEGEKGGREGPVKSVNPRDRKVASPPLADV